MSTKLETVESKQTLNDPLTSEEFAVVQDLLMEQLGVQRAQVTPDADIEADLGADSLDKVEIVMKTEERFNVTVADDLAERVRTVEDLCAVLAKRLGR